MIILAISFFQGVSFDFYLNWKSLWSHDIPVQDIGLIDSKAGVK